MLSGRFLGAGGLDVGPAAAGQAARGIGPRIPKGESHAAQFRTGALAIYLHGSALGI